MHVMEKAYAYQQRLEVLDKTTCQPMAAYRKAETHEMYRSKVRYQAHCIPKQLSCAGNAWACKGWQILDFKAYILLRTIHNVQN